MHRSDSTSVNLDQSPSVRLESHSTDNSPTSTYHSHYYTRARAASVPDLPKRFPELYHSRQSFNVRNRDLSPSTDTASSSFRTGSSDDILSASKRSIQHQEHAKLQVSPTESSAPKEGLTSTTTTATATATAPKATSKKPESNRRGPTIQDVMRTLARMIFSFETFSEVVSGMIWLVLGILICVWMVIPLKILDTIIWWGFGFGCSICGLLPIVSSIRRIIIELRHLYKYGGVLHEDQTSTSTTAHHEEEKTDTSEDPTLIAPFTVEHHHPHPNEHNFVYNGHLYHHPYLHHHHHHHHPKQTPSLQQQQQHFSTRRQQANKA